MTISLKDDEFEKEVLGSDIPVLVDFWAEWCGPCRQLVPTLDAISEELKDKCKIVKMNIDENPMTPQKYSIRSIPTMLIFKNGKLQDTKVGALTKTSLLEWINEKI